MTASVNMSMQMIPDIIRPNRKAKNDANTRMTLNDYGAFVHPANVPGVQSPNSNVYIPQNALMLPPPPPPPQVQQPIPQETVGRPEEEIIDTGRRRRRATDEDEHPRISIGKKVGRRVGAKVGDNEVYDENSLFGAIKSGRVAPQALVDDWIEQYKSNRDAAMLELMQFFISCSGCRGKITPEMYSRMSHADIIRRMTEEFDEDSGEYPLIQTGPVWRRFRSYFVDFIAILIRHCQYSIVYDQYMMEQIIALLTGLTDSQVRAFRHTSTLASMKMMTALVDVALTVSINLDNTQRQYEAERAKSKVGRSAQDRLEILMQKRKEMEENMNEVKNMMTYLFKGVFVHRYRDSQPEIRSICMNEIGFWMRKYPNMFLDDSYLKYVGWTLYDRVGEVRLQCLRSLQPLYEDPQLIGRLELFTNRFKARLVDMTLDKETEVGVQAVRLICTILKYNENILEDKDCENIYELVYSSHRQLSQAAGEFLNRKLFQLDSHAPVMKTKKGKKRSVNTPLVRDLVQFFIESELHEHAAYLVDSLWDINSMLRDWECMLDLLLEDPGRGEEPLDDRQETSLIEIMTCCIKQAATGESPIGRQPAGAAGRKQLSARELRTLESDRTQLTSVLMSALPPLLMKYNLDGEKMLSLLQIPLFMELEMYTTNRQEKHLDMLLKYLQETVEKHNDMEVLIASSKAYEAMCAEELSIATKCQIVKSTLLDQLSETYKQAFLDYYNEQGDEPDEDDEFLLLSALKKIYAFSCCHDMTSRDLWNSFITVSRSALERPHYNEEIVAKGISCASQTLMWRLRELDEYNNQDKNEIKNLKKMLNLFLGICCQYLKCQSKKIARESYVSICDLIIIFSRNISNHFDSLQALTYEPDKELESGLMYFLNEHVFIEDQSDEDENTKIEELHNRRTYLACYSKLIIYNVLPVRCASLLFKHFVRFYNDYGDIMKLTLTKTKEINKLQASRAILSAIQSVFLEVISDGEPWESVKSSDKYYGLKELVRRLSLSFGLDLVKIRDMIFTIHVDALHFSIQSLQQNLPFIEFMTEFSNKLSKSDKKILADYVNKLINQQTPQMVEILKNCPHMMTYRTSLDPELAEVASNLSSAVSGNITGLASGGGAPSASGGGGRGRAGGSGKRARESMDITMSTPQMTSTAAKKRRGAGHQQSVIHQQQTLMQVEMPPDESTLTPTVKYSSRGRPIR